jgi:hypothetical protein
MRYTPKSRDRYKNLLALLTGAATFGSFVATGAVTGAAARQTGEEEQAKAAKEAEAARVKYSAALAAARQPAWTPVVTLTDQRPQRTVVREVSGPGPAPARPGQPEPVLRQQDRRGGEGRCQKVRVSGLRIVSGFGASGAARNLLTSYVEALSSQ